jgi:hypothetical protein
MRAWSSAIPSLPAYFTDLLVLEGEEFELDVERKLVVKRPVKFQGIRDLGESFSSGSTFTGFGPTI